MAWVLVTGGSSGIGAGIVELLAGRGWNVICADVDQTSAELLSRKLAEQNLPCEVRTALVDVADGESIQKMFDDLEKSEIVPTGLVNCAGINVREPAISVSRHNWDRVLNVNLRGTFEVSSEFAKRLLKKELPGQVVNLTSMLSHYGAPMLSSYSASKGGVMALTRTLAIEWAEHEIRVNAVSPGYIRTALSAPILSSGHYANEILARTPMGRIGTSEEVASVVAFLLSENSRFMTGQILPVDGGITAGDIRLGPTG